MERFENSVGMVMQRIPAGSFSMGGGTHDDPPALPVHTVTITEDYYLAVEPVRAEQFAVYEQERYGATRDRKQRFGYVIGVTYEEAAGYAEWLSAKEKKPYYLPTEAEWEYAAGMRESLALDRMCDPQIREWCYDWYAPYDDLPKTDPAGPENGRYRCVRGGWLDNPGRYQAYPQAPYYRCAMPPAYGHKEEDTCNDFGRHPIGFRVAMGRMPEPKGKQAPPALSVGVRQETEEYRLAAPPADVPYFRKRYLFPVPPDNCTQREIRLAGFPDGFRHHHHSPGMTAAANGDLICSVYSTRHEYDAGSGLVGTRLRIGEDRWEFPDLFLDPVGINDHAPMLYTAPDGTLYHFWGWEQLPDSYPFQYVVSKDNGATWSEEQYPLFANKAEWVTRQPINTAIHAKDGTFYLAADSSCNVTVDDTGVQRVGATSVLWRSRDGMKTWENPKGRTAGRHTTAVELSDGSILALGGKNTDIDGYMPAAITKDGGDNYQVIKTGFPAMNSGQRPSILRLASGRLVVCGDYQTKKNKKPEALKDKAGSYVAWSDDDGKTWHRKQLWGAQKRKKGTGEFGNASTLGYSVMKQSPDGLIHIICSNVHPLLHLCFNECWLLEEEKPEPPEAELMKSGASCIVGLVKEYREYDKNGQLRCQYRGGIADDGRFLLEGEETFYNSDGMVQLTGSYRLGQRIGVHVWYDPQGNPLRRYTYPEIPGEQPECRLETFWPGSSLVRTSTYFKNGMAEGTAYLYDREGNIADQAEYCHGKIDPDFDTLEKM